MRKFKNETGIFSFIFLDFLNFGKKLNNVHHLGFGLIAFFILLLFLFFILKMYKLLPFNAGSLLECHTIVFMKYIPRGLFFNLQNKQVK
jgi:hypothetical protein